MPAIFKKRTILNALMGSVFVSTLFFTGSMGGITGQTKKTTTDGCDCHGSASSAVTVSINGPATLAPGATGDYTLTITGGPLVKGGTNIAASAGTLAIADNSLRLAGGELTHTGPKSPSANKVTFSFKYTAPASVGQVTLFANGNSVNGNSGSNGDQWNFAPNKVIDITTVGTDKIENNVSEFALQQNYPNPFNPATKIHFTVPASGNYTLKVYSLSGEEVTTLLNSSLPLGAHDVVFNAGNIPSGVYIYRLTGNGYTAANKMILSK